MDPVIYKFTYFFGLLCEIIVIVIIIVIVVIVVIINIIKWPGGKSIKYGKESCDNGKGRQVRR
jgi:hypothetical protein